MSSSCPGIRWCREAAHLPGRPQRTDFVEGAAIDTLSLVNGEIVHVFIDATLEVGIQELWLHIGEFQRRLLCPFIFHSAELLFTHDAAEGLQLRFDDLGKCRDDFWRYVGCSECLLLFAL